MQYIWIENKYFKDGRKDVDKESRVIASKYRFVKSSDDPGGALKYLGSTMCEDGKYDTDIRIRNGNAKASFGQLRKLLTNLGFRIETRMRILKAYVLAVLLLRCKSLNISKEMRMRLRNVFIKECQR